MRAFAPVLTILVLVSLAVLSKPLASHAAVLTFDIEDPTHTQFAYLATPASERNMTVYPGYGNNVTAGELGVVSGPHSTPSAAWGTTSDYGYGAGGGATPDVTVQYLLASNGNPSGYIGGNNFDNFYGVFTQGGSEEIRFTPAAGFGVQLDQFLSDTWVHGTLTGQTLEAVEDFGTASPTLLWGSVGNNTLAGPQTWTPAVSVEAGHTLSLVYGSSGDLQVTNVQFSEFLVPEPTTGALLIGVGGVLLRRRRNR